jgi:Oligonucleotide/oligosaccharide-binding (OB)-fold
MDSETATSKRPSWLANDLSVSVHPSSILHPLLSPQYQSPFVVFSEKMQTSSIYMRDISVVPAIALVLFGGNLEVHHDSGYIHLDAWLKVCKLIHASLTSCCLAHHWVVPLGECSRATLSHTSPTHVPCLQHSEHLNEMLFSIYELSLK